MKNKPIIIIFLLVLLLSTSIFSKKIALLIGLNNYLYLPNLKYAEKDAKDLETVLKIAGFDTFLLTGQTISGEAILEQINFIAKYSSYSDTLVFFFSGHGAGGSTETEKGMLTAYSDPERKNAMVSHSDLKESISKFKGKKIVVVDACNQGYETKSQMVRTQGLKNAVDFLLFSSASNQESHDGFREGKIHIDNGIAAYYLRKAIEGYADFNTDNSLSAGELEEYLTKNAQFYATKFGQYMEVYNNRSDNDKLIELLNPVQQAEQKGTLIVESTPSGAEIWINGNQHGQTNKSFTADPGTYEVELIKSGYETYQKRVTITSGSTERVDPRLEEKTTEERKTICLEFINGKSLSLLYGLLYKNWKNSGIYSVIKTKTSSDRSTIIISDYVEYRNYYENNQLTFEIYEEYIDDIRQNYEIKKTQGGKFSFFEMVRIIDPDFNKTTIYIKNPDGKVTSVESIDLEIPRNIDLYSLTEIRIIEEGEGDNDYEKGIYTLLVCGQKDTEIITVYFQAGIFSNNEDKIDVVRNRFGN